MKLLYVGNDWYHMHNLGADGIYAIGNFLPSIT